MLEPSTFLLVLIIIALSSIFCMWYSIYSYNKLEVKLKQKNQEIKRCKMELKVSRAKIGWDE